MFQIQVHCYMSFISHPGANSWPSSLFLCQCVLGWAIHPLHWKAWASGRWEGWGTRLDSKATLTDTTDSFCVLGHLYEHIHNCLWLLFLSSFFPKHFFFPLSQGSKFRQLFSTPKPWLHPQGRLKHGWIWRVLPPQTWSSVSDNSGWFPSATLSHSRVPPQGLQWRNALRWPSLLGQVYSVWAWENGVRHFFTMQSPLGGWAQAGRFYLLWNTGRFIIFQLVHI